jgi:class 3 adenylate cyclase/tetratricopeptide (TPR) repeat protein
MTSHALPSFGDLLRQHRLEAGLSQEELAEVAGISARAISDLEREVRHRPYRATVTQLAKALGLSEEERSRLQLAARTRPPAGDAGWSSATSVHTFVIADVRGYTQFTLEQGDEAAALLATRFAALVEAMVDAWDGQVIELRGDEALAVFASARQSLRAAVELQARLHEEAFPLGVGVGLDAGEAIGVRGGYRGTALNLAARLCSLARAGEVLASEGVIHLARKVDGLAYGERGSVQLKGFREPVKVIAVTESLDQDHATEAESECDPQRLPVGGFLGSLPVGALVARGEELTRLLEALEASGAGQGRLLLLAGEPGIGKTRLAQELTRAAHDRGFLVAAGRCYQPEHTVPYYPFLDALATLWDIAPAAIRSEAARRWPHLGALLPEALPVPPASETPGQDDQQRVFRALTGFLEAMAAVAPLALLLDDLHWADGSSLKLLRHLATHTRSCRLLLLASYRDVEVGRQHPLEGALLDLRRDGLAETIPVRRLALEGTAALVAATLGHDTVPPALAERLHARTEGNPFFITQVLDVLLHGNGHASEPGRWDRATVERLDVPESIRAVVGRRLSQLTPETQAILHEAGVLGQSFHFDDLQQMSGRTEEDVETALEEACQHRLLAVAAGDEYGFDHVLTQQVLHAELPARRKRRLHLLAGEMLEQRPAAQREKRVAELAWHFHQADEPGPAMRYALAAGDHAAGVFAYDEAEQQYRTALILAQEVGKREDEANALDRLGRALNVLGRYDEALAHLEEAAAIHHTARDLVAEIRTVAGIAEAHYLRGTVSDGVVRVEALLAAIDRQNPPPGTAGLYYYHLANQYFAQRMSLPEVLTQCEWIRELARAEGDTVTFLMAEASRGFALRGMGRHEEAVQIQEAVAPLVEEHGNQLAFGVLMLLAETYLFSGRLEQARTRLERNVNVFRRWGDDALVAYSLAEIGDTHRLEGDWQQARAFYEEALHLRGPGSHSEVGILPVVRFAQLAVCEGKWSEAEPLLDEAMALARENQSRQWLDQVQDLLIERALLHGRPEEALAVHQGLMDDPEQSQKLAQPSPTLAMLFLALGDVDGAGALNERGFESSGADRSNPVVWAYIAVQARVLAARREWNESEAAFLDAIRLVRQLKAVFGEAQVLQWHGEMLAAHGEVDRARHRLREARAIYARVGAAPYLAQTDEALKQLVH